MREAKIIIAGGGSGGHLFPALSIADALVASGVAKENVIFFGSKYTLEKDVVPKNGYKIELFPGRGINKSRSLKSLYKNMINLLGLIAAFFKAFFLILKIKPAVVVGVGGFASFPAICGAKILRRNIVVHEQNAVLGRINSIAQKFGAQVLTTFDKTEGASGSSKVFGLPLRAEVINYIQEKEDKVFDSKSVDILVFGGSLGARCINNAVVDLLKKGIIPESWNITLVSGKANFDEINRIVNSPQIRLVPFIDNLFETICNSDLVVSRAGAGSCVELEIANVKSILIPLAIAPGDHQSKNASELIASKLGILIREKDLSGRSLFDAINSQLDAEPLKDKNIGKESRHLNANISIANFLIDTYLN